MTRGSFLVELSYLHITKCWDVIFYLLVLAGRIAGEQFNDAPVIINTRHNYYRSREYNYLILIIIITLSSILNELLFILHSLGAV